MLFGFGDDTEPVVEMIEGIATVVVSGVTAFAIEQEGVQLFDELRFVEVETHADGVA